MTSLFKPQNLDVREFARQAASLSHSPQASQMPRVSQELHANALATATLGSITARGEIRTPAGGQEQVWLHLKGEFSLSLVCQRCLTALPQQMGIERSFRFVATEEQAEQEDNEFLEEDLLVISKQFDLLDLLEDEILMELPFAPKHERCPANAGVDVSAHSSPLVESAEPKIKPFAGNAALEALLRKL